MEKFVRSKSSALEIWRRKDYYRLDRFCTSDILKIYLELHPSSPILSRMIHYKAFISFFSNTSINEITSSQLHLWFYDVKNRSDLSERTLLQIKSQLSPFFKWLAMEKIIDSNPLLNLKFRRNVQPKRKRCVLQEKEVESLVKLAKLHDPKVLFPYLFAIIQTGARRSEVSKLTWDDIDLESGHIVFRNTKNGSDRKILIATSLRKVIESQNKSSQFVFYNQKSKFLNRSAIERMINDFKRAFPFEKDWHIHDLRHSFANNFLKKGGEMYQLQAILGHRSIQMTVDLYGNLKSQDIENPSPYSCFEQGS